MFRINIYILGCSKLFHVTGAHIETCLGRENNCNYSYSFRAY